MHRLMKWNVIWSYVLHVLSIIRCLSEILECMRMIIMECLHGVLNYLMYFCNILCILARFQLGFFLFQLEIIIAAGVFFGKALCLHTKLSYFSTKYRILAYKSFVLPSIFILFFE